MLRMKRHLSRCLGLSQGVQRWQGRRFCLERLLGQCLACQCLNRCLQVQEPTRSRVQRRHSFCGNGCSDRVWRKGRRGRRTRHPAARQGVQQEGWELIERV